MIFSPTEQRKNVEFLARFLENRVPRRRFDMGCFTGKGHCGTVGCALGWSTQSPSLKRRGIGEAGTPGVVFRPTLNGVELTEGEFAAVVFGDDAYDNLFRADTPVNTPKQWAKHARKWLLKGVR